VSFKGTQNVKCPTVLQQEKSAWLSSLVDFKHATSNPFNTAACVAPNA